MMYGTKRIKLEQVRGAQLEGLPHAEHGRRGGKLEARGRDAGRWRICRKVPLEILF